MSSTDLVSDLLDLIESAPGEPDATPWMEERAAEVAINSIALAYMMGGSPAEALHVCARTSVPGDASWEVFRARLATLLAERAGGG